MSYPQIVEYNDAIQSPHQTLADPVLQGGQVRTTQLGLPHALSGGFALTYEVQAAGRRYAVRCFHVEVPGIEARYSAISQRLKALGSPYFVEFDFQPNGIRVAGRSFPIIKMDWVDGQTLGQFLESNSQNAQALAQLQEKLRTLAGYLESQGIAHGDLQNENIIIAGQQLRLIDYDGMFVPGLPVGKGTEVGHKHFQHPLRATKDFGPAIDRFSSLTLDLSLRALSADATLHQRFSQGGTTIVFRANDFADPHNSEVFRCLRGIPNLRVDTERFANLCLSPIASVPTLRDFLAGKGGNEKVAAQQRPATKQVYLPAFAVVDASAFVQVERAIGQRVELVGKIYSVFEGTTRGGGRRGGRPYVFISFNDWRGNSVKLTLWSEALLKMTRRPDQSWVGRWVSVTGLIEPPYRGRAEGISYVSVGITIQDATEIVTLTESEARFRLGAQGVNPAPRAVGQPAPTSNRAILDELRKTQAPPAHSGRRPPSRPPRTVVSGSRPTASPPHTTSNKSDRVPWFWIVVALGILLLLFQ